MSIIADTGYWLALANRRDTEHERAKAATVALIEPLVATWPVLTETCHLLLHRLGHAALEQFLSMLGRGGCELFELSATHLPRIQQLMIKYRDPPMDLADASLVVLAENRGDGRILSTDRRDFRTYRWKNRRPFQNLLD